MLTFAGLPSRLLSVLEYGERSLADFLKRGQLQRNERKFIVDRLANVVQHLHAQNVVHCDLKPHNFVLFGLKWKVIDLSRPRTFLSNPPRTFLSNLPRTFLEPSSRTFVEPSSRTFLEPSSNLPGASADLCPRCGL